MVKVIQKGKGEKEGPDRSSHSLRSTERVWALVCPISDEENENLREERSLLGGEGKGGKRKLTSLNIYTDGGRGVDKHRKRNRQGQASGEEKR